MQSFTGLLQVLGISAGLVLVVFLIRKNMFHANVTNIKAVTPVGKALIAAWYKETEGRAPIGVWVLHMLDITSPVPFSLPFKIEHEYDNQKAIRLVETWIATQPPSDSFLTMFGHKNMPDGMYLKLKCNAHNEHGDSTFQILIHRETGKIYVRTIPGKDLDHIASNATWMEWEIG